MTRTHTTPAVVAALLVGCASAGSTAYVAPTYETVLPDVEVTQGEVTSHTVFVHNRSTVPVRVYALTLTKCLNVVLRCDQPIPLDIRIPPGARMRLQRIEPRNRREGFTYRYTPQWRAEAANTAALAALAENGSEEAQNRLRAIQRSEEMRRADLASGVDRIGLLEVNELGARVAGIVTEPESLAMRVGESVTIDQIRIIVVGQGGERLGRLRGFGVFVRTPLEFVRPDTIRAAKAGSTVIEFTLPDGALPDRAEPVAPARLTVTIRE